jgi:hypothetical protein
METHIDPLRSEIGLRRIENSETEERRVTEMAEKDQRALLLLEWLSVKFRVKMMMIRKRESPCLTGGVAAALTTKELFFCEADATGFEPNICLAV